MSVNIQHNFFGVIQINGDFSLEEKKQLWEHLLEDLVRSLYIAGANTAAIETSSISMKIKIMAGLVTIFLKRK